jgi:hypothetical protein
MMRVHILDGLGNPLVLPAGRVLITTDNGTPMALAVQLGPGVVETTCADDADFNVRLRVHGIDRSVQVDTLRPPKIADFDLRGER